MTRARATVERPEGLAYHPGVLTPDEEHDLVAFLGGLAFDAVVMHGREARRVFDLDLEPRSAYVLAGAARSSWQHSIPPVPALRYSVTFRTLRGRAPR